MREISNSFVVLFLLCLCLFNLKAVGDNTQTLNSVEVKEYKGEKLGNSNDFRENSIKGPQHLDISKYQLIVNGLVDKPLNYTYRQLLTLPSYQKIVTLNCVEGWSVKVLWEGFLLKDLMELSGVNPKARIVIFYATDGYTTSLPLSYIINNKIIMAYKMNGVALKPEQGFPLQLVADTEWGYKWIKWVTRIELTDKTNYKGYWESRGYSNDGSLNQDFL